MGFSYESRPTLETLVTKIRNGEKNLKVAMDNNDREGFITHVIAPVARALREYNDAAQGEEFRQCLFAGVSFNRYADLAWKVYEAPYSDHIAQRDDQKMTYRRHLAECKKALAANLKKSP